MSKRNNLLIYFIIYLSSTSFVYTFEPVTISLAGIGLAGLGKLVYDKTYCYHSECCSDKYITADFSGLRYILNEKFYGQHLAMNIVVDALSTHWRNEYSRKALTLSFHGLPGTGKNYLTTFIKQRLFKNGASSKYVHHFMGRIHFSHADKTVHYKNRLYSWIKGNVSECPQQLFIFDEVDKIPEGVLDVLKPMIDYNDNIDKVDYRKVIFIFLSNTGAKAITEEMLKLWRLGKHRNDIKFSDFEKLISKGAFNEKGGFYHSDTIRSNLIDHYIPFLPMELEQVRKCIIDEFRSRGVNNPSESDIQEVIDYVEWGPEPENKFSKTGCKRLSQKVALVAYRH